MSLSLLPRIALSAGLLLTPLLGHAADRVLLVVSGHGGAATQPLAGFDMDEYAQAYWLFRDHGYEVQVASPAGGEAVADRYEADAPYNARLLASPEAMAQLRATRKPGELDPAAYRAVLVIGGKGAMFDLPEAKPLQSLLARHYQQGGVLGAVCHGAAALVDVKLDDGSHLVRGRAINAFTRAEETLFSPDWAKRYPFMLEDRLRERGARFESAPPMLIHVAQDERLYSGQNPFSTAPLVEAMLRALGTTPKPRKPGPEETSLRLIARLIDPARREQAEREFLAEPARYQPKLIAIYGQRRAKGSDVRDEMETGLRLMTLAAPHFPHPKLELARVETLKRLGREDEALTLLRQANDRHPAAPELKQALAASEKNKP